MKYTSRRGGRKFKEESATHMEVLKWKLKAAQCDQSIVNWREAIRKGCQKRLTRASNAEPCMPQRDSGFYLLSTILHCNFII